MKSVAPASKAQTDGDRILVAGHHDDRDGGEARLGPQPPADRIAVQARHVHIQQDDRDVAASARPRGPRCRCRRLSGSRPHCADRFDEQQTAEILIVGDDGERGGCGCCRSCARPQLSRRTAPPAARDAPPRSRAYSCCASAASPASHSLLERADIAREKASAPTLAALDPSLWHTAAAAARSARCQGDATAASAPAPSRPANSSTSFEYRSALSVACAAAAAPPR